MYKIEITKTHTVEKTRRSSWEQLRTEKEADAIEGNNKGVYGYTPEITERVEQSRNVLTQEVEELDLTAVIKALNGI